MNNETWLKTKGISISQLVEEGIKCYSVCRNINTYCKGVLSAIQEFDRDKTSMPVKHMVDILQSIQEITKQAKFTYYEKIEKEENDNEK